MHTPVLRAAAILSRHDIDALAVTSGEGGPVIGIVTDRDLRDRVIAEGREPGWPVLEVMTAPLVCLPDSASMTSAADHAAAEDPSPCDPRPGRPRGGDRGEAPTCCGCTSIPPPPSRGGYPMRRRF